jgi:hypothetical protein
MRSIAVGVFSSLFVLLACGPGPTPETPSGGGDGGASTTEGKTTPLPSGGGGGDAGAGGGNNLATNKKAFLEGCAKGGEGTNEFCECAWGEMLSAVGEAKMGGDGPSEKDLMDSHPRVMAACKAKMPEAAVKKGFMIGCVGDRNEMQPYCDCSWAEFRKDFSPGDLGDETIIKSDKFNAARVKVTKTCGSKIPEKVVKDGFLKACVRDPKLEKFCGCAWDELKKMASPAEIEAGLVDQQKMNTNLEKSCSKYKPAGAVGGPSQSTQPPPKK